MRDSDGFRLTEWDRNAVADPAETEAGPDGFRPSLDETEWLDDTNTTDPEGDDTTVPAHGSRPPLGEETVDHVSGGSGEAPRRFGPERGRVGRYRVERRLGRGTFGVVYLATDEIAHRQVAIKLPHRSRRAVEADYHEIRILARLDHEAIVPVYDGGRLDDGRCYIVSKFIDGESLKGRLLGLRPAFEVIAEWVARAAEGLHYAHTVGVIHRDVKPANLLIDAAGNLYVGDFGTALREGEQESVRTFAGTPAYTSPEQARGEGHRVNARSDVFSLGVVLYEALTGVKPFESADSSSTLRNVANLVPKSPREIDASVPAELERICLNAMAKRNDDRYESARAMAADLRHWLDKARSPLGGPPAKDASLPRTVAPRGLRPYEEADSGFFLDLLPGPRGRDGLPDSLRFWRSRVEPIDSVEPFPVGVIYGPTGGGKSSFVRAGLIPSLGENVRTIYVESTASETESRLARGLRRAFPHLPAGNDLARLLRELRGGRGLAKGKKVLIVLDQFEQWLFGRRDGDRLALENALRQCDGVRVQVLLVVRDEFWMDVTRLAQALEVRLADGWNSAAIDLFDLDHARKVLTTLGQAHERLPADRDEFTPEQSAFLDQALQGLAQDGRVVCVRLVLFAELLRDRPWTPETLRRLGGVKAVGVTVLDEAFSAPGAKPQNRANRAAARAVLERLLPEPGVPIKGHMVSRERLLEASGYAGRRREFNDLIWILDHQLRLVTPADAQSEDGLDDLEGDTPRSYQLAHDYLIPELREWLLRDRQQTIRGRAWLRLREFASVWSDRRQAKFLPTTWEWVTLVLLTDPSLRSPAERSMLRAASLRQARLGLGLVVLFAMLGSLGSSKYGEFRARSLVDRLKSAETGRVLEIAEEIRPYRRWASPLLRDEVARAGGEGRAALLARLALLGHDAGQVEKLAEGMVHKETAQPLALAIGTALLPHRARVTGKLWDVARDPRRPAESRLRAALALAKFDPPHPSGPSGAWRGIAEATTASLLTALDKDPASYSLLVEAIGPLRSALLPELARACLDPVHVHKSLATSLVADLARDDPKVIGDLVLRADPSQFAKFFPLVGLHREALAGRLLDVARQTIRSQDDPDAERVAHARAMAAVCLLRLGEDDSGRDVAWDVFRTDPDPRARSILIHQADQYGIPPDLIADRLATEEDPARLRGLILAAGRHVGLRTSPQVAALARERFLSHGDPGVRGSAEWLLKRIDPKSVQPGLNTPPATPREAGLGGWYRTGEGHVMVVIDARHEPRIGRVFAIASKETTIAQMLRLPPSGYWHNAEISPDPKSCPASVVTWPFAVEYCRKLTLAEGLGDSALCYPVEGVTDLQSLPHADCDKPGFRPPTRAEWEYACRAGTKTRRHFGVGEDLMNRYAWCSAKKVLAPVGSLMPNDYGLFDMYGNVSEWTADVVKGGTEVLSAGGAFHSHDVDLDSAFSLRLKPDVTFNSQGLRVARTIELDREGRPK